MLNQLSRLIQSIPELALDYVIRPILNIATTLMQFVEDIIDLVKHASNLALAHVVLPIINALKPIVESLVDITTQLFRLIQSVPDLTLNYVIRPISNGLIDLAQLTYDYTIVPAANALSIIGPYVITGLKFLLTTLMNAPENLFNFAEFVGKFIMAAIFYPIYQATYYLGFRAEDHEQCQLTNYRENQTSIELRLFFAAFGALCLSMGFYKLGTSLFSKDRANRRVATQPALFPTERSSSRNNRLDQRNVNNPNSRGVLAQ
jgi:hypothetical protein